MLTGDRYGEGLNQVEYEVGTMVDAAIRYDEIRRDSGDPFSRNVFLEAA